MKNRRIVLTLGTLALTLALTELAVRASGLSDFPVYLANSEIGYIPAPSQSGAFLRKNYWQFNSKSMGAPEFSPSNAVDTLLIGDSVVAGGNPFKEQDRLGPQLHSTMKNPVWPIAAGSWGLRNELKYLKLTLPRFANPMKNRRIVLTLGTLALTLALAELAVRASGLSDFPVYLANSEIGYIPAPSQSGAFLRKNYWQFNSKSMGAPEFSPSNAVDTLLIGDSVVAGGNPFKEQDRLGPQLHSTMKNPVWPIAAGSWGLRNELKYLKLNPEVVGVVDQFVFVNNNGDFDEASSWSCEKSHPLKRPVWATLYVFRKYVWDWAKCDQVPQNLLVQKGDWKLELKEFLESEPAKGKPVIFVLYPNRDETQSGALLSDLESHSIEILAVGAAANANISVYSVARDPRWKPQYYRDSIHPTVEGTRVLAEILSKPAANSQLLK